MWTFLYWQRQMYAPGGTPDELARCTVCPGAPSLWGWRRRDDDPALVDAVDVVCADPTHVAHRVEYT